MPPLRVLGRDWHVSSDDLFVPAVFGVLFHGAWSIVLLWLYATAGLPDDCPELVRASKTGAALLLASFLLTTLLQLWLMVETMQGALLEEYKRRRVPLALYALFVSYACEAAALIVATHTLYEARKLDYADCYTEAEASSLSTDPAALSFALVWTTWSFFGAVLLLMLLLYNLYPDQNLDGWVGRVTCISRCFCCFGAMTHDTSDNKLERLAKVLGDLLAPLNFTFTDLACALMLVGITHRSKDTGRGSTAHMHAILSAMGHGMAQEVELRLSRHTTEQGGGGAEAGAGAGGGGVTQLGTLDSLVVQGQMVQDLLVAQQRLLLEQASLQPAHQAGSASRDSRVRFAAQQGLATQHSDGKLTSTADKQQRPAVMRATSAPPNSSQLAAAVASSIMVNGTGDGQPLPRSSSSAAATPGVPASGNGSAYSDVFLRAVKHAGMSGVGRPAIMREASGISSSAGLGSDGDLASAGAGGGEVSLELLQEALHWHKYALAIYGTVMFLWSKRHSCMNGLCCITDDDDYWPEPYTHLLSASNAASQPPSAANSQPPSPTKAPAANGTRAHAAAAAADIEQGGGGGSSGRLSTLDNDRVAAAGEGSVPMVPGNFLQRLRQRWRPSDAATSSTMDEDMSPRRSALVSAAVTVDAKLDPAGQAAGAKQPTASAGSKVNDGVLPEMEPVRLQTQLMQLAITQMANIPASSLVYTNFSNVIEGLLPYMICVDHQKRAVVVAIRGSLSLEDVVTDVLYDPVPLDEDWLLHPTDGAPDSRQAGDDRDEEQEELEEQLQQHPEQQRLQQVNPAALHTADTRTARTSQDAAAGTSSKQQQRLDESSQQAPEPPACSADVVFCEQQPSQQEQEQEAQLEQQQQEQGQGVFLQRLTSTSSMKMSPFTTAHDAAAAAAVGFSSQPQPSSSSSRPAVPSRLQQRSQPGSSSGVLRASQSIVSYDPAAAYVPGVATAPPPRQHMGRHQQQQQQQVHGGATLHSLMSERGTTTSSSRQRRHEAAEAAAQAAAAAAVAALHSHSMLLLPSEQGVSQQAPQPQQLQQQTSMRPERRLLHQASSKIMGAFSLTQQPSRVSTVPSLPPRQQEGGSVLEEGGAPGADPELLAADRRAAEVEARASEYRPDVGSAGGGWYAHEGIYRCARAIRADLRRHQLLDALLLGEGGGSLPDCSGYDLLITGHSLGAGVAALLALHYRQVYPGRVRAWTFAPPGGLISPGASDSLQDICYSLVTSKDMIPRMSLWSMERLRDEMMFCALRCKVSKRRLIGRAVWALFGGRFWSERGALWPLAKLPEEACRQYRQYRDNMVIMRSLDPPRVRIAREFVPPGRIIWLEKVKVTFPPHHPSSSSSMQTGAVNATSARFRSLFSTPGSSPASNATTPHAGAAAAAAAAATADGPQEEQRVQQEADIVEKLGGGAVALEAVAAEVSGDAGSDTASGGGSSAAAERLRSSRRHPRVRTRLVPARSSSVAMITEGMVVSRSMFSDHLPDTQYEWLKRLVRQLERGQQRQAGGLSMQNSCADTVGGTE